MQILSVPLDNYVVEAIHRIALQKRQEDDITAASLLAWAVQHHSVAMPLYDVAPATHTPESFAAEVAAINAALAEGDDPEQAEELAMSECMRPMLLEILKTEDYDSAG